LNANGRFAGTSYLIDAQNVDAKGKGAIAPSPMHKTSDIMTDKDSIALVDDYQLEKNNLFCLHKHFNS